MPQQRFSHTPLLNAICNSQNIFLMALPPERLTPNPVPIKTICELLRDDDKDFPMYDFDFKDLHWTAVPGTIVEEPVTKTKCIMWKQATHNASTIVRLFRQLGWELTFTHWVGYD